MTSPTTTHDNPPCSLVHAVGAACLGIVSVFFHITDSSHGRVTLNCRCGCHQSLGRKVRV